MNNKKIDVLKKYNLNSNLEEYSKIISELNTIRYSQMFINI